MARGGSLVPQSNNKFQLQLIYMRMIEDARVSEVVKANAKDLPTTVSN